MNNRFKFRVWDKYHKQWIGACAIELDGTIIDIHNAIPETNCIAQQYTGLNDKNGKEIFEGDIVKINRCYTRPFVNEKQQIDYKFIDDGEVEVGQVLWGWNSQKYLVSYEHIRYDDIEDFDKPSHRVEVIGNIFEHKHLLEK